MVKLSSEFTWRTVSIVTVVGLALVWLLSGVLTADDVEISPSIAKLNEMVKADSSNQKPVTVRTRRSVASEKTQILRLNGKTEVKHIAIVKSETTGQVVRRNVDEGTNVKKGDPLCSVEVNDRETSVAAAQAAVEHAELVHEGALLLKRKDYQRESEVVAAKASLSASQHALARAKMALENTVIRAPVSGYVERVHTTVGDYLVPGAPCATILDLDPIYLVIHVAEQFVEQITLGAPVEAELSTGESINGDVSFIGKQAIDSSRTFRVEVAVSNEDYRIRAGLTAEVGLPLQTHLAHQVSTALLVLGDTGTLGVHTVSNSKVEFHEIEIISEDSEGVWIGGLENEVTIITVGQDLVSPGQVVNIQRVSS